jgi:hypothetical protein
MPNGIIQNYSVTYYLSNLGPDSATVLNTGSLGTEFNISGLLPFTNYSVSVAAITIAVGEGSGVVTVRTNQSSELCSSSVA